MMSPEGNWGSHHVCTIGYLLIQDHEYNNNYYDNYCFYLTVLNKASCISLLIALDCTVSIDSSTLKKK